MRNLNQEINNEKGSVMVIVIMVVVVLTITGLFAIKRTGFESNIVLNETLYKDNFFQAEGVMNAGCLEVSITNPLLLKSQAPAWLFKGNGNLKEPGTRPFVGMEDVNNWDNNNSLAVPVAANFGKPSYFVPRLSAVYEGVALGGSLDMAGTQLHQFTVYGGSWHRVRTAGVIIQSGFLHRY